MTWYWVILIIILYLFGIGVSGAIFENTEDDKWVGLAFGLIWPAWIVTYIGYIIFKKKK